MPASTTPTSRPGCETPEVLAPERFLTDCFRTKYIVNDGNRGQIGVNAGNNRQGDCYRFACEETSVSVLLKLFSRTSMLTL